MGGKKTGFFKSLVSQVTAMPFPEALCLCADVPWAAPGDSLLYLGGSWTPSFAYMDLDTSASLSFKIKNSCHAFFQAFFFFFALVFFR